MTNITFKQEFTFNKDAVKGFALHLGWKEKLTRQIRVVDDDTTDPVITHFEDEEYDNPQTFVQFIEEKAREHTLSFTKSWAQKLKQDYLNAQVEEFKAGLEPTLDEQIIKPVEDALTSEITIN